MQNSTSTIKLAMRGSVVALDYGVKRIGVAIGELELLQAHPLQTISAKPVEQRNQQLEQIINEWRPVYLVIGVPFGADGLEHPLYKEIVNFAKYLSNKFQLQVHYTDETLSSHFAAENQFAHTRKPRNSSERQKTQEKTDSLAAQIILQTWFSELPNFR